MSLYSVEVETQMVYLYRSLSEKDRRRYAAIEAAKLGHGGIDYVATLLGCDPKTIRQGQQDLDHLPDELGERVRKKATTRHKAKTLINLEVASKACTQVSGTQMVGKRL